MKRLLEYFLGNKAIKLQNQSLDVLDVFTKTITDLEDLNKDIDKADAERAEIIRKAQEDRTILGETRRKNLNVIAKLHRIFENE